MPSLQPHTYSEPVCSRHHATGPRVCLSASQTRPCIYADKKRALHNSAQLTRSQAIVTLAPYPSLPIRPLHYAVIRSYPPSCTSYQPRAGAWCIRPAQQNAGDAKAASAPHSSLPCRVFGAPIAGQDAIQGQFASGSPAPPPKVMLDALAGNLNIGGHLSEAADGPLTSLMIKPADLPLFASFDRENSSITKAPVAIEEAWTDPVTSLLGFQPVDHMTTSPPGSEPFAS